MIARGEIWWADLPAPAGSEPGFRRPVLIVQSDEFNRTRLRTTLCVPLTSNLAWAEAAGNVLLPASATGLPKDSVANVTQLIAIDRTWLTERVRSLHAPRLEAVLLGIELVLGR